MNICFNIKVETYVMKTKHHNNICLSIIETYVFTSSRLKTVHKYQNISQLCFVLLILPLRAFFCILLSDMSANIPNSNHNQRVVGEPPARKKQKRAFDSYDDFIQIIAKLHESKLSE
eukprot:1095474_1